MGFFDTLFREHASPGPWYSVYNSAWHTAHPGAWQRRELDPGSFFAGDVWASSTLDWDLLWFKRNRMRPPKKMRHVAADQHSIPLTHQLNPGESTEIRVRADDDE